MLELKQPKVAIANVPTPVDHLSRLSEYLGGPQIYMKRDDYTGFALGGNKVRKLEYLIAEALEHNADTLVTTGAIQSNHCRQTAAAAAKFGLKCHLVLTQGALNSLDYTESGNILLDRLTGCTIHFAGSADTREEALEAVCERIRSQGGRPFSIPLGGSSPTGAVGYAAAVNELSKQINLQDFRAIVFTTGSGGTQAGLVAGLEILGSDINLIGVSCAANSLELRPRVARLVDGVFNLLGRDRPSLRTDILVDDRFIGEGYGETTPEGIAAIQLCAELEGIFLDPVYTGKAMAGLIAMIRSQRFLKDDKLLFIHTGGSPALFAYRTGIQR